MTPRRNQPAGHPEQGERQGRQEIPPQDQRVGEPQGRQEADPQELHSGKGERVGGEPAIPYEEHRQPTERHPPEEDHESHALRPGMEGEDIPDRLPRHALGLPLLGHQLPERLPRRQQEGREGESDPHRQDREPEEPPAALLPLPPQEIPHREEKRRPDDRRRPQVEPDREASQDHIRHGETRLQAPPPGRERRRRGQGEEGHRQIGAGDPAVEDEEGREGEEPGENEGHLRRQPPRDRQGERQEEQEPADDRGGAEADLRQLHPGIEEQPEERGERDAVVALLVGGEDRLDRHGNRRPHRVDLVAVQHLGGEVAEAQGRPEEERGEEPEGEGPGGGQRQRGLQIEIEPLRNSVLPRRALTSTGVPERTRRRASASTGRISSGRSIRSPRPPYPSATLW